MSDSEVTSFNDTSDSSLSEDDIIVGRFVRVLGEVNTQPGREQVLTEFCHSHPPLTTRFLAVYDADHMARDAFSQVSSKPPVDFDLPGEFDGYIIVRKIDHKGMAEIYEAYDKNLKRPVAIKIIRCERRFIDQAQCEQHLLNVINAHSAGNNHQDYSYCYLYEILFRYYFLR